MDVSFSCSFVYIYIMVRVIDGFDYLALDIEHLAQKKILVGIGHFGGGS